MAQVGNRRWWTLGALLLAVFAVGLDATILSVALPTLAGALHASESDLQWFSSAYLLAMAAAILPVGLLGDRWGHKTLLLGDLALFEASSAAAAYAPSATAFIAARVVLGLAGAGIVVLALAVLTVLFAEEERPRAVSAWAATAGLSGAVGPILGGWLLSRYWWGWVFLLNVPVTLVALAVSLALVPPSRAPERPGLDPFGVVASTAGLASLIYGLIEAGQNGWGDAGSVRPATRSSSADLAVSMMIGTGETSGIDRATSSPWMSGMRRSSTIRSGCSRRAAASAARPVAASVTA